MSAVGVRSSLCAEDVYRSERKLYFDIAFKNLDHGKTKNTTKL